MIFADTHVLLWLLSGDSRLPLQAREALLPEDSLVLSAVTAWEYADLQQNGRLPDAPALDELVAGLKLRIEAFPPDCWRLARQLPPIHGDPVDRMLIAHAVHSNAILATADANMRRYPVTLLW